MKKLIDVVFGEPRTLIAVSIILLFLALSTAPVCARVYTQTNLVADQPGVAAFTDPNLVNAWGIVLGQEGVVWIADNHSGMVTSYAKDGTPLAITFTVPPPAGSPDGFVASPTGLVANDTQGFQITDGIRTGRSTLIVASEDGTISGYNPFINTTKAILKVDNSATGAVYKGLAIATNNLGTFIYATNFNAGTVDVFDSKWNPVTKFPFVDHNLPAGYAPFGIRAIGDTIFVTYALQDSLKHDDSSGPGHGFIDRYTTQGRLIGRFASGGVLNSPWGLEVAPSTDLRLGRILLLVGNFGDGRINTFNRINRAFVGPLQDTTGNPIQIGGLWGLAMVDDAWTTWGIGPCDDIGPISSRGIFFTAGPNGESNGLFGVLKPQ